MPRRQILDFLTQFARVYHSEPALRTELCGLVMKLTSSCRKSKKSMKHKIAPSLLAADFLNLQREVE